LLAHQGLRPPLCAGEMQGNPGEQGHGRHAGGPGPRPPGAERLLRHLRERLRALDGEAGKYALKTAAAKARLARISAGSWRMVESARRCHRLAAACSDHQQPTSSAHALG